jgi:two-component system, chemotaxis family, chemotaxis protein CheY
MPKVLVIDDSRTTRMFYRETLEAAGFGVDEALNGLEGLEKTMASPFDLLIVDINMPKMDGLAFLRELRRRDEVRSLPAIVISTQDRPEDRARAHAAGANVYFVKPVDPHILVEYGRLMTGALRRLERLT